MKVTATVPTRIDLAGGTLDLYPLYLFEGGGLTVNAAIDIFAYVVAEERNDPEIHIQSADAGVQERFDNLAAMLDNMGGSLDLAKKALRYYCKERDPAQGLNVTMKGTAPRGSGLGTSSALLMALSSALNEIEGLGLTKSELIDLGANIEAQVIDIPTGKQDYFPPLFGGVCSVWFDVDGHRLERLDTHNDLIAQLNQRLVLSFTNINRFSGVTNWAMIKRYIDREGDTVSHMGRIKRAALSMRESLAAGAMEDFARLLALEWENRKALAAGVTTPEIDAMVEAAGRAGARASKLCGAGGGGCMITYAEPDHIPAVKKALEKNGATLMPFQILPDGIQMDISH